MSAKPIAYLTDKKGATIMHGLIVVPTGDPAQSAADLKGYRIIFGPEESAEKHAAAIKVLKDAQVELEASLETVEGCDEGARRILEAGPTQRGAAVISSYAAPLLEVAAVCHASAAGSGSHGSGSVLSLCSIPSSFRNRISRRSTRCCSI